jgi:hypothetical protein
VWASSTCSTHARSPAPTSPHADPTSQP